MLVQTAMRTHKGLELITPGGFEGGFNRRGYGSSFS